jgi:two-component system, NarL family, nitrate/nitrite response regulator NarL
MITVYLHSDLYSGHSVLAEGLKVVFAESGGFHFEVLDGTLPEVTARLQVDVPDVLLLDLSMEALSGTLRAIRLASPNCKLVLWVETAPAELGFLAMRLGVRGILRKALPATLIVNCIQKIQAGDMWFEKTLTDNLKSSKRVSLSPREGQLITLLTHGMRNKEIAGALRITEGTVKVYLSRLFQKVGVKDRFELALFGLQNRPAGEWRMGPDVAEGRRSVPSLRSGLVRKPANLEEVA